MNYVSRHRLFYTTALIGFLVLPVHAMAGPDDGNVTSGSAAITTTGPTTTINQSSDRAIIRWGSFDVNNGESVQFNQPSASSITVNRIQDTKASQINGHIGANGNIVLINPNGLVFGAASTVDVGSLVATTSDLEDDNAFMNGGAVKFTKPGNPDARVINRGHMTVKEGGLVGLVAPNVENHGVIEARLGKVALASGDISTVDFAGDGLIKLEVSDAVLSQSVTNTGTIKADGGSILLTAAQARGMVEALITNTGTLQANTVTLPDGTEKKGEVVISTKGLPVKPAPVVVAQPAASPETTPSENSAPVVAQAPVAEDIPAIPKGNGTVINTGTIIAQGAEVEQSGGNITIIADKISLGDGSYVEASGDTAGGSIKIGGDYQGGGTNSQGGKNIPTSDMLYISEHATINANSRRRGPGGKIILWSDDVTRFYGTADVSGGTESGDGGFIEISSKGYLDYTGTVNLNSNGANKGTLLLDPTDITISTGSDSNVSASTPFSPNIDNGPSVLNITTLQNALASGNVTVQTRATGSQNGDITLANALTWSSGNTLTLSAHNNVVINGAISGSNLTIIASDINLSANVVGTGTLTLTPLTDSTTVGFGNASVGTFQLLTADIVRFTGWSNIIAGRTTSTAAMDLRGSTWASNLTLQSGTGAITVNGAVSVGLNNLTIITDGDIATNVYNIGGSGTLTLMQATASSNIGFGDSQTGALSLTAAEFARFTTFSSFTLGRSDGTGTINIGAVAAASKPVTILSNTGVINFNGVLAMGSSLLTITTDADINFTAANTLTGSATLTINQRSAGTTMGIGASQTGTINLSTSDLLGIKDGFGGIVLGRTDGTGAMNIGTTTWTDSLTLNSGSGVINMSGDIAMAGNNLTINANNMNVTATSFTGTGSLTIAPVNTTTTIGLGDSQTGTLNLTASEINSFGTASWSQIIIGRADSTAAINIGAANWNSHLIIQNLTGVITISGTQTFGASKNATYRSDSDMNINGDLVGSGASGTLTFVQASAGTSMGIATGQAGTIQFTDAEIARSVTWGKVVYGRTDGTGAMNIGTSTWGNTVNFLTGSGAMNINGVMTMGNKSLVLQTDSDLAINANIVTTGGLAILGSSASTSIGIGTGQAGTLQLDDAEIARWGTSLNSATFGAVSATGAMNIGAYTWGDAIVFRTGSGQMNINGAQAFGGNAATFTTDSDLAINAAITTTSTLTLGVASTSTGIGVGTGQVGSNNISDSEIALLSAGTLIFSGSGGNTMNVGAYTFTGTGNVRYIAAGSIIFNGAMDFGSKAVVVQTSSPIAINADWVGTGTVTFATNSAANSMGIGTGQTGSVTINDASLNHLGSGFSNLTFGTASVAGAINVGARTWANDVSFISSSGSISFNGITDMGSKNLTISTNANPNIGAAINGTGTLTIGGSGTTTTIGVGTGQTGTIALTNAELANIGSGWSSILIGTTSSTATMNIGATTWNNNVTFRNGVASINVNGAITMNGGKNLSIIASSDIALNAALIGSGVVTLGSNGGTTMGVGTGRTGTITFSDAELDMITDGWSSIVMGGSLNSGAMSIGTAGTFVWKDNVTFQSSGTITGNDQVNTGANNLTLITDSTPFFNAALTGTGTLTISQLTPSTTMSAGGSSALATINIIDSKIAMFTDGWKDIILGRNDSTGSITATTATWLDNITYMVGSGFLTISGVQNVGANNLTLITDSNIAINAALNGTGTLTVQQASAGVSMAVGTGQTGTVLVDNTELGRFTDGWTNIVLGKSDSTAAMNVAAETWLDSVTFQTGTGLLSINGAQTVNANNLTISSDSNFTLTPNLAGTGILTIKGSNNVSIGVGDGQAGTISLTNAKLAKIIDGWSQVVIGSPTNTGDMNIGGRTWTDKMVFVAKGSIILNGAQTTTETSGTTLVYATTRGSFVNNVGASVINPGSGRYLIYSLDDIYDTMNGITTPTIVTNKKYTVYNPSLVTQTGNVHLYSGIIDKIIYLIIDNKTKAYGDALPTFTYTYVSGLQGADTLANALDVSTLWTVGSSVFDNAGTTRTILSDFSTFNGYSTEVVDGTLTVAKANLTATTTAATREYGDANPTFAITYTGFKNSETSSVIDTLATASTLANATSNVGAYAITGAGAVDNNYNFTYVNNNLTITKAALTATVQNNSRLYGDANPTFGITYTGFKNSETSSVIDTLATASSVATATSNVGSYTATASGAVDNNYSFNYVSGTLTVNKATLTATANNAARDYGDANPTFGITYTGFKNSETSSVIDTLGTASSTATNTSNVGTYAITASGAVDNNYSFNYVGGTLTVNKAVLTATANNAARDYGDANPTFGITYTGFKNSETSSVIDTLGTASSAATGASNSGTYAITASGAVDNNYSFNYVSGTLTVNKAILTATANNAARDYGDANPTFGITYTGFKNSETSSVIDTLGTASSTATNTSNAGTYAITASGAVDNNYSFNYVDGTLTVNKVTLTATVQNNTRIYGDADPSYVVTYSGFKNGETSSVVDTLATVVSGTIATSNVGSYTATASGAVDNNYNFAYVNGTLTVTKAVLTATANNAARDYGDANPAFGITYTGFKNGETSSVIDTLGTASSAATSSSNAGTYAITASGAVDNNYSFNYVSGTLTVNKAILTATANNAVRDYGDVNPTFGITYTGFKNSETSSVIDTLGTASSIATNTSNAGTYAITASGAVDNNYDFNYVGGTLTVNKVTLTATADSAVRDYGDSNPALSVTYTGFKNGETVSVIDTLGTASTGAIATSNAGVYVVTASGASDNNYNFGYANGTLTVNKVSLTATANNVARDYGDANPTLGITYTGFKNGETSSVIDTLATASTTATTASNVGSYGITVTGALDNNYTFAYVNGTLTVNKATLTATANNAARDYGDANPTFGITYTGFKNSETSSVIDTLGSASSTGTTSSNAGTYAITASGAVDDNYSFNYVSGTLTVNKAILTATANNAARDYGDANPTFGITYTGFKNSETSSVIDTLGTASSTATNTSNAGTYAITASGAVDNNYSFNYVGGTLTVNKAVLTATANNAARNYGDANPTFGITYTGFKNGETSAVIDTLGGASSAATNASIVGTYGITASGALDNNYSFNYVGGTLTVNKAMLTATANNAVRDYGDANPAFGITYTGFKNGETSSVIDTLGSATSAATSASNAGSYGITASGAADINYDFTYVGGTLTINKALLTASTSNDSRIYGDANPSFVVNYTGFKNGETSAVIDTLASVSTSATQTSNVGNYAISVSGASDNNYMFNYVGGTLTVTKAMLTARAEDKYREIGQANPVFTVAYTGFKNSETASVLDTRAVANSTANLTSPMGTYVITASGGADNNYAFTYLDGTLSVLDVGNGSSPPPPESVPVEISNLIPATAQQALSATAVYSVSSPLRSNSVEFRGFGITIIDDADLYDRPWDKDIFLIGMTNMLKDFYSLNQSSLTSGR